MHVSAPIAFVCPENPVESEHHHFPEFNCAETENILGVPVVGVILSPLLVRLTLVAWLSVTSFNTAVNSGFVIRIVMLYVLSEGLKYTSIRDLTWATAEIILASLALSLDGPSATSTEADKIPIIAITTSISTSVNPLFELKFFIVLLYHIR